MRGDVQRPGFGQPQPWVPARLEELDGTSIVPFAAREFDGTVNRPAPVQAGCLRYLARQVSPGKKARRLVTIISMAIAARIMPMSRWVIAVTRGDR